MKRPVHGLNKNFLGLNQQAIYQKLAVVSCHFGEMQLDYTTCALAGSSRSAAPLLLLYGCYDSEVI